MITIVQKRFINLMCIYIYTHIFRHTFCIGFKWCRCVFAGLFEALLGAAVATAEWQHLDNTKTFPLTFKNRGLSIKRGGLTWFNHPEMRIPM